MATMREVAKMANVSVATVSAVINDSAYVSPELKRRVLQAIEELNYTPNVLAKFLRFNKTSTIGVIIPGVHNPFYSLLVQGIEDAAWNNQQIICLGNSNGNIERELAFLESLLQRKVDGVIVATAYLDENPTIDMLESQEVPYVLVNRKTREERGSYIGLDNKGAASLATEHLISLGKQSIAIVQGPTNYSTSFERTQGYLQMMKKYDRSVPTAYVEVGNYTQQGGYEAALRLMQLEKIPDGIFCANDLMAFGVIECFLEHGYHVPDDVSVVGCDNIHFSGYYRIPLTTVKYPIYQEGELAVQRLLDKINGKAEDESNTILKPQLVIRKSCGGKERIYESSIK